MSATHLAAKVDDDLHVCGPGLRQEVALVLVHLAVLPGQDVVHLEVDPAVVGLRVGEQGGRWVARVCVVRKNIVCSNSLCFFVH